MLTPAYLKRRIAHRPNLVKIIDNIGWLFFDRVLRMAMGLFVGIWVARYLGPEQFGLLNYATAFVAMFGTFATLGLNGIVVRDLVKDPQDSNLTLGTTFFIQFIGGAIAFATIVATVTWLRPEDALTKTIVATIGCTLIFKSSDAIRYWYESQVASRFTVIVENSVFLLITAFKAAMILMQAPLLVFVWAIVAEAALVWIGLFAMYVKREHNLGNWSVRLDRAKTLLQDSWPLILSGLAVIIYMRVDQLMLKEMVGAEAVGIYSAALRISEAWYTVPTLLTASLFPSIIESKRQSEALFQDRMQKLLNLLVACSLTAAILTTLAADWLVATLFGPHYAEAAPVLMIHGWAGVFTFLGVASRNWYILQNMTRSLFYRTLTGAIINIPLNLALIPWAGAKGAALATVISFSVVALFYDLATPQTRPLFKLKINALSLRWAYAIGK